MKSNKSKFVLPEVAPKRNEASIFASQELPADGKLVQGKRQQVQNLYDRAGPELNLRSGPSKATLMTRYKFGRNSHQAQHRSPNTVPPEISNHVK